MSPTVALAALAGLGAIVLAVSRPKAAAGLALLVIFASGTIESKLRGGAFAYVDEAAVLYCVVFFCLRRFVRERRLILPPGSALFAGFALLGVLSDVIRQVDVGTTASGTFLAIKGVVVGFAFAQLHWSERDLRPVARVGAVLIVGVFATCLINLAAPTLWTRLIQAEPFVSINFGLPALIGPFVHPAALGRFAVVLFILVLSYVIVLGPTRRTRILMVMAGLMAILSFRTKSWASLATGSMAASFATVSPGKLVLAVLLVPLAFLVVGGEVLSVVETDVSRFIFGVSARSTMTVGAIATAAQYFPLGAGFGRYGSFVAGSEYSPEYLRLGFPAIRGLEPGGNYLTDTQWPSLIAEPGFFGAALFALGLGALIRQAWRAMKTGEGQLQRWLGTANVGLVICCVTESIAAPVFTSAPSYPVIFIVAGVLASLHQQRAAAPARGLLTTRRWVTQ